MMSSADQSDQSQDLLSHEGGSGDGEQGLDVLVPLHAEAEPMLEDDGTSAGTKLGYKQSGGGIATGTDSGIPLSRDRAASSVVNSSSIKGVVFNLVNTVIGVGVLTLPFCFKVAGSVFSIVLLLIAGGLTERSLCLLVDAGMLEGQAGYSKLVKHLFGERAGLYTDSAIVAMTFGSSVAYLDIIADICCSLFGQDAKVGLLFSILVVVLGPLCLIRQVSNLQFTSVLGICVYSCFTLIVIGRFFSFLEHDKKLQGDGIPAFASGFLEALPIQLLAFACHTVTFPVYKEYMESPGATQANFKKALRITVGSCLSLYIIIGLFGALTFGEGVHGDVLMNYIEGDNWLGFVLQFAFAMSVCFTFPLLVYPLRDSLRQLLQGNSLYEKWHLEIASRWNEKRWDTVVHITMTIALLLLIFLVAVLIPSVTVVFGLIGSSVGVVIMFLIPALAFLRSTRRSAQTAGGLLGVSGQEWGRIWSKILLYFAVPLGFASFIVTLIGVFKGGDEEESFCGGNSVNGTAANATKTI